LYALVDAGFIDSEDGRTSVHDWNEYAGKLLEKRANDRERKRKPAAVPTELQRKSDGTPKDGARTVSNYRYDPEVYAQRVRDRQGWGELTGDDTDEP